MMHVAYDDPTLADQPDTGCCYGSAIYGPGRCTCWEPVHDAEQQDPVPAEPTTRDRMCDDCAFRADSPERTGDDRYEHAGDTDSLLDEGRTFWCHQGMRRKIARRHPDGREIPVDVDAYHPAIVGGVAFKADGSPADRCAGWANAKARAVTADG